MQTQTTETPAAPETQTIEPAGPHHKRWERMREENKWDASIRNFAKVATHAVLRFDRVPDAPSWLRDACVVEIRFVRERRDGVEESLTVKFAGFIDNGRRDALRTVEPDGDSFGWKEYSSEADNLYKPESGSWYLPLYPGQATHAQSCLLAIPSGAKVTFRTRLDYHSSPTMAEVGLHGDVLVVEIDKGKRRSSFNLDSPTTRHNSARFGYTP